MPRDLAISCEGMDCERLLANWRWLVPTDVKPLMVGVFGDWVLGAPDNSHWHLDLLEGKFGQIARDSAEFNVKKREERYRDEWFGAEWAAIAFERGLIPKHDECLGWRIAPILGGAFVIENIEVFPLAAYQSIQGQLFRQLAQR